jgi:hypothetical protein
MGMAPGSLSGAANTDSNPESGGISAPGFRRSKASEASKPKADIKAQLENATRRLQSDDTSER